MKNYEKYQFIAENTINPVALIEADGTFQFVSPAFETLDFDRSLLETSNFFDIIHPNDQEMVKKDILLYLRRKRKETLQIEFRICNIKGEYIDVEANIITNSHVHTEWLLVVFRDIRSRKEIEKAIYHLAYHDSLTNLPNRRSFMNQLRTEMINRKSSTLKMSILFIDLDNFKTINDQWGHDVGDLVLQEAIKYIQAAICPTDLVGRLGSDEFIVMLKDVQNEQDTMTFLKRILAKFQSPIIVNDQEFMITCSIGVANYPEHGDSPEELIKNADNALYHIKGSKKNEFIIFNKAIENESLERRLLESALRNALQEQQFYVEYQPKINILTNELVGMEALIRWKHPDLGTIPPGKFISLAEEMGLIVPIGEWILRESCRQTKEWQEKGYSPLLVSVNVSVRQLEDPYFITKVEEILKETCLHPKWLELEVTESVLADVKSTVSILKEVQKLGLHISVDDFGTGYSSLSYIKELPVDIVKVDQSFVKDIHTNEESRAIVKAILHLAESIGLKVIAEGIELQEHVDALRNDGYILGQGFYFSKPLNMKAFEAYMNNH